MGTLKALLFASSLAVSVGVGITLLKVAFPAKQPEDVPKKERESLVMTHSYSTYTALLAHGLIHHGTHPGDELCLTLRNEITSESMFDTAKRLNTMFLLCYTFFPESISLHPDHVALIKKQGRALDITISEEAAPVLRELMDDLTTIPRRIPLKEDESLDLFTAVARYTFREDTRDLIMEALKSAFGS